MSKSYSFIKKYLFSSAGIVTVLAICIGINLLLYRLNLRIDLTEDKLYSLSPGTKQILHELDSDTRVSLRFYRSRKDNLMPVFLRSFAKRVEDILGEYVEYSDGKLVLEIYDPSPDSDAEDSAAMDGIRGQNLPDGRSFYLGLAVNCLDQTVSIPFLSPAQENKLEYEISRAIVQSSNPRKPKIGLISPLPVMGGNVPHYVARNKRPKPPWIFMQELKRQFLVEDIGIDAREIPQEIDLLLVIHPKDLAENTIFAIDQYLMRGGKIIIAIDPYCLSEARNSPQAMMGNMVMPGSSPLPELLSAWGLQMPPAHIIADMDNAMRAMHQGEVLSYPTVLDMREFDDSEDIVMSSLAHLNLVYAGEIIGEPAQGIKMSTLLESSGNSQMIRNFKAELSGAEILKEFAADNRRKKLIVRLEGTFPSAFPDGLAKKDGDNSETETGEADNSDGLLSSSGKPMVILISDVDMLADEFCVTRQNILGQSIIQPFNDNLNLIQGIVEFTSGDDALISIRSKQIKDRPFTRIMEMQAEAQDHFQKEINKVEEKRQEVQQRLNQLQQHKSGDQKFILSPEQKAEIKKYENDLVQTNKKMKELRKELRREIERLQFTLQAVNIAAIPAIVILFGIGLSVFRNMRRKRG